MAIKLLCVYPDSNPHFGTRATYLKQYLRPDTELIEMQFDTRPITMESDMSPAEAAAGILRVGEENKVNGIYLYSFLDPVVRAARVASGFPSRLMDGKPISILAHLNLQYILRWDRQIGSR